MIRETAVFIDFYCVLNTTGMHLLKLNYYIIIYEMHDLKFKKKI